MDPFEVLREAGTLSVGLAERVEAAFAEAERQAIETAPATDHAAEVIAAARTSGRCVGIVSNNSVSAVNQYLQRRGIVVDLVEGRASSDASLLKPSPYLITRAVDQLNVPTHSCTLLGDSVTDVIAARAAGVRIIGYANKSHKPDLLSRAGADIVVEELTPIAAALTTI